MKPTGNDPYIDHLSAFEQDEVKRRIRAAVDDECDAQFPPYRAADARRDYPELKLVLDDDPVPKDGRRRQKPWAKPLIDDSFPTRPFFKTRRRSL